MNKTVLLNKDDIYSGNLLLVNAVNPINTNISCELVPSDVNFPDILIRRNAANFLQLALKKISAGNSIIPVSGYRSKNEQTEIYNSSFKENGGEFTRKYVAMPDCSEHQTGLAIDLGLNIENIDFIRPDFPNTGICGNFRKIAADFGFIERYSKSKEHITGIAYEPWHFRYVGYPHSKIIVEKGLALEEYAEFIKDYHDGHRFVYVQTSGAKIEIYYVPAVNDKTEIHVSDGSFFQFSGNNCDGFIITSWYV